MEQFNHEGCINCYASEQQMVLVKSGLNSKQVSLMRSIHIKKMYFDTEMSGLNSESGLTFRWSSLRNLTVNIFRCLILVTLYNV